MVRLDVEEHAHVGGSCRRSAAKLESSQMTRFRDRRRAQRRSAGGARVPRQPALRPAAWIMAPSRRTVSSSSPSCRSLPAPDCPGGSATRARSRSRWGCRGSAHSSAKAAVAERRALTASSSTPLKHVVLLLGPEPHFDASCEKPRHRRPRRGRRPRPRPRAPPARAPRLARHTEAEHERTAREARSQS